MCYQRPHELYLFTLLKCYIDIEISVWHETNIILFFIAPSPAADDGKKDEELHTLQLGEILTGRFLKTKCLYYILLFSFEGSHFQGPSHKTEDLCSNLWTQWPLVLMFTS
jgi:hypothetical protein